TSFPMGRLLYELEVCAKIVVCALEDDDFGQIQLHVLEKFLSVLLSIDDYLDRAQRKLYPIPLLRIDDHRNALYSIIDTIYRQYGSESLRLNLTGETFKKLDNFMN